MIKLLSLYLIFAQFVVICGSSIAGEPTVTMIVNKVLEDVFSSNFGKAAGISRGDIFYIVSNTNNKPFIVGKSKVVYVEDHQCALKIIEKGKLQIQNGDLLIKNIYLDDVIRNIQEAKGISSGPESSHTNNYYLEGKEYADDSYNGTGAFISGLASGFTLGALGWGLGFFYLTFKNSEIPKPYSPDITANEYEEMKRGYTEKTRTNSRITFSAGALAGIAGFLITAANMEN